MFGRRALEAVRDLESGTSVSELDIPGVTPAVIDASFEVHGGETFVVMGLSGSGKSTLIRMLNGLLPATAGRVCVDGEDITAMSRKEIREMRRSTMSMVFQHFALFPHRTVLQNAAYGLQIKGMEREERLTKAQESLDLVGLGGWENHLPEQLSGGMRQRVGLARALAADTDILLMDEAFSALDPLIRREMQDQLLSLQAQLGKTIIFITHDLNEAMRLGDRIAMMRQGRIEQIGTAEDILAHPANDYVAQFVRDVDRTRVLTASSVMEPAVETITVDSSPSAARAALRESRYPGLHVLDREGKLVGVVTDTTVADATERGSKGLHEALTGEHPVVHPDTPVHELFTPAAASALPLPVVDKRNILLGVVPTATLLGALGEIDRRVEGAVKEVVADA
ncbi:quaternary amine ABC transporter ATP-binding protein [Prauserella marina]|uniref:quaternary amine ABC transporter ATP-binding protein n=1 Tax=Prauserella marina TaxID=530584 RepID=UPI003B847429